jgi:hypothetical protein
MVAELSGRDGRISRRSRQTKTFLDEELGDGLAEDLLNARMSDGWLVGNDSGVVLAFLAQIGTSPVNSAACRSHVAWKCRCSLKIVGNQWMTQHYGPRPFA